MALTAKSMPYKSGFGPFAGEVYRAPMSYPFRDRLVTAREAARLADRPDREAGRRGQPGRGDHRADPGRGRLRRPRPRLPARARRVVPGHGVVFIADEIQTGFAPHRRDVRLRARGRRAGPGHHRQGHRRRPAARGGHRPGRDHGRRRTPAGWAAPTAATRSPAPRRWARIETHSSTAAWSTGPGPSSGMLLDRLRAAPAARPADRRRPRPRRHARRRVGRPGTADPDPALTGAGRRRPATPRASSC